MLSPRQILEVTAHRPCPLPTGKWLMRQTWRNLLLAHWPLPANKVAPLIPRQFILDLYDHHAWIGVAPFQIEGIRARGLPSIPGLNSFAELNVRTYVSYGGIPGVYFFSLDAASRMAVWGARLTYFLPYFHARMRVEAQDDQVSYESRRVEVSAEFEARYRPNAAAKIRDKGSVEHFLTERYCLYAEHANKIYRAHIHHHPWPLQDAEAEIRRNTVASAAGVSLSSTPPVVTFREAARRADLARPESLTRDAK